MSTEHRAVSGRWGRVGGAVAWHKCGKSRDKSNFFFASQRERLFFFCCFCCHKKQWIHLIFRKLDYFSCCSRNYLSAPNEVLRKSHFRHVSCKFPMKQRAHMQMVFRQLGLCLIYTKEFLFKYLKELNSCIYCIIITCIYLIVFIIILEHFKSSQVQNAIKFIKAWWTCQMNTKPVKRQGANLNIQC